MSVRLLPGDTIHLTAPDGRFMFRVLKAFSKPSKWTSYFVQLLMDTGYIEKLL